MKSYHFDLGDSNEGPIGFCARVEATSPTAAVAILQERLRTVLGADASFCLFPHVGPEEHLAPQYVDLYFNVDAITTADIDEVNEA